MYLITLHKIITPVLQGNSFPGCFWGSNCLCWGDPQSKELEGASSQQPARNWGPQYNMSQRTELYQQPREFGSESLPKQTSDENAAPANIYGSLVSRGLVCAFLISRFRHVQFCATLWTVACQGPLSMALSRQFQYPRILEWVAMPSSRGSSRLKDWACVSVSPALAGRFFTTRSTWEAHKGLEDPAKPCQSPDP